jgi:hypothetical protein
MQGAFVSTIQTLSVFVSLGMVLAMLPAIYKGDLFAWHPVFMTVGFLGFMCEGILAAYRFRGTEGAARVAAIENHLWIQVASTVCIALGFYSIYRNKVGGVGVERVASDVYKPGHRP